MKYWFFIFLLLLQTQILFGTQCTSSGGSCQACGAHGICIGGTGFDHVLFNDSNCTSGDEITDSCYDQTELSCLCAGCSAVQTSSGDYSCMTASCSGACSAAPEPSSIVFKIVLSIMVCGWLFITNGMRNKII